MVQASCSLNMQKNKGQRVCLEIAWQGHTLPAGMLWLGQGNMLFVDGSEEGGGLLPASWFNIVQ